MKTVRYVPLLLCAFLWLITAACDSGDPIDEPEPADVAGTYDFTRFEFIPDAAALPPYSLLDTLVASETNLRVLSGGDFILFYQFKDGNTVAASGDVEVSATTVSLGANDEYRGTMDAIMLSRSVRLQRDDPDRTRVLTAEIRKNVDLARFSDRYAGIPPVNGVLHLRLVMR